MNVLNCGNLDDRFSLYSLSLDKGFAYNGGHIMDGGIILSAQSDGVSR